MPKFILVLLIICLFVIGYTPTATACTRAPIPWFIEEWQVTPDKLPQGLLIDTTRDGLQKTLRFTNNTKSPIYLLKETAPTPAAIRVSFAEYNSNPLSTVIKPNAFLLVTWPYEYAHGVKDENHHIGGERPENVKIPLPQDSYFGIIHQNEYYTLPVRLIYTIKPDYEYYGMHDCPSPNNNNLLFVVGIGCVVGLGFIAVIRALNWTASRPDY